MQPIQLQLGHSSNVNGTAVLKVRGHCWFHAHSHVGRVSCSTWRLSTMVALYWRRVMLKLCCCGLASKCSILLWTLSSMDYRYMYQLSCCKPHSCTACVLNSVICRQWHSCKVTYLPCSMATCSIKLLDIVQNFSVELCSQTALETVHSVRINIKRIYLTYSSLISMVAD